MYRNLRLWVTKPTTSSFVDHSTWHEANEVERQMIGNYRGFHEGTYIWKQTERMQGSVGIIRWTTRYTVQWQWR